MNRAEIDSLFDAPTAAGAGRVPARKPLNLKTDPSSERPLPKWARCGDAASLTSAAVAAGASLLALDQIVKSDSPSLGAFRMRQALIAATASARLLRRREDEADLRDAHHLSSDSPGPAGLLYRAWRVHAARPTRLDDASCDRLAKGLSLDWTPTTGLLEAVGDPIATASKTARVVTDLFPCREGEVLGLMLADVVLASRLAWPVPVPLLATAISSVRAGSDGRRARPGDPEWSIACYVAVARAAAAAHARALEIARRADNLLAVVGGVRTRHRETAVKLLLEDDAVSPAGLKSLGSERAARRFLTRLVELGAIRELTGRQTFRLYGL